MSVGRAKIPRGHNWLATFARKLAGANEHKSNYTSATCSRGGFTNEVQILY